MGTNNHVSRIANRLQPNRAHYKVRSTATKSIYINIKQSFPRISKYIAFSDTYITTSPKSSNYPSVNNLVIRANQLLFP